MNDVIVPGAALGAVGGLLVASFIVFRFLILSYREERRQSRENYEEERKQWAAERLAMQTQLNDQDRQHHDECARLETRLQAQEDHTRRCDRRLNMMIVAAQQHGMPIPEGLWKTDA